MERLIDRQGVEVAVARATRTHRGIECAYTSAFSREKIRFKHLSKLVSEPAFSVQKEKNMDIIV
jgi:hypothetical protein